MYIWEVPTWFLGKGSLVLKWLLEFSNMEVKDRQAFSECTWRGKEKKLERVKERHARPCSDTLINLEISVGSTYNGVAFLVSLGEESSSTSQQLEWQVVPLQPREPPVNNGGSGP